MNDEESMKDFVSGYESLHENESNEDDSNTSNTDTNNPDNQDTADNDTHEDADDANDTDDSKDTESASNIDNEYDSRETGSNFASDNTDAKNDEQDSAGQDLHNQENVLSPNAEIQKLCESITQLNAALDRFTQTTTQLTSISAQLNISNAKIDQLTASLSSLQPDVLKKHCEEISQTYHHLENTNKIYSEIMNAMPAAAEKKYTSMVKKHAAQYQKLLERVSRVIERELLPDNQKPSYYIFAAIAAIQTALLFLLLHH